MRSARLKHQAIPLWRDVRVLQALGQIAVLTAVVLIGYFAYRNTMVSLAQMGKQVGLDFLTATAGFTISDAPIPISRESTFGRVYLAGLLNTLLISVLGIMFATILGTLVGIARLSTNYLVNKLATVYFSTVRNIPLLVLLVFWYAGVFMQLPPVDRALVLPGPTYVSSRGLDLPWPIPTAAFSSYAWVLLTGLFLATAVAIGLIQRGRHTGRQPLVPIWTLATFLMIAALGWLFLPAPPLAIEAPIRERVLVTGGHHFSAEFTALLSGLVLYEGAFIGEVVRAGIQSVPRGQADAARALGLNVYQVLRVIVLPQAMRLIIPPLTGQYLVLIKSSSLGIAVGYSDLFAVSGTIFGHTSKALEVVFLLGLTYLALSLLTSAFMNWYNWRTRLVER